MVVRYCVSPISYVSQLRPRTQTHFLFVTTYNLLSKRLTNIITTTVTGKVSWNKNEKE